MKHMSVRMAAIGCTMRIEERSCRVFEGREKFDFSLLDTRKAGLVSDFANAKAIGLSSC